MKQQMCHMYQINAAVKVIEISGMVHQRTGCQRVEIQAIGQEAGMFKWRAHLGIALLPEQVFSAPLAHVPAWLRERGI